MPDDTPKYAMGVGKPEEIVECAKMGYNLFDCVIPTREARKNKLYVFSDKYNSIDDININESDFYKVTILWMINIKKILYQVLIYMISI